MRETDEEAALLGRIAVRYGFITMEQLAEATRERGRGGKKLGAIMLERGMLDELELGKVLALQKRHRDALAKKKVAPKREPQKRRIPTPKDWAFDAPRKRSQAQMPRRERRTGDVVRERIGTAEPEPPTRKPRPVTLDSRRDDVLAKPNQRRQRSTRPEIRKKKPSDTAEERSEAQKSPNDENNKRSEQDKKSTRPGMRRDEFQPPPETPPTPKVHRYKTTEPDMPAPQISHLPETPKESPGAKAEKDPEVARPPQDPLEITLDEAGRIDVDDLPPPTPVTAPPAASVPRALSVPPTVSVPPAPAANLEPMPWNAPPTDSPKVKFLIELLEHAVESEASDVHVHAGAVARMRQLGRLVPITETPLAAEATLEALVEILTPWQQRVFEEAGEIDFAYEVDGVSRFRANVYRQHNGTNGVFHIIPQHVPTLASLGLPQSLAKLTNFSQGLILVTGPAGCGKTSTLAALTNIINEERTDHILTIEDPIEYVFKSKRCVVNQRQVGRHTESFASGLRGALREDPDIICIGELRDLETISLALSAAETGHLVLATVHTGSAIGTINRIVGAYPPGQQAQVRAMMSESLRAITSQRLLPGTDGRSHVALETLFITRAVGALIRDNRTFQIGSIMQTGRKQGQRLLDDSLRELLEAHRIDEDVALANCHDPRRLGGA